MTVNPVRRIAVLSVALVAIAGLASCSSTEAKAKTHVKKVSRSLHADVVRAYDKSKQDLESLGADLDDADSKTGKDATRPAAGDRRVVTGGARTRSHVMAYSPEAESL